MKLFGLEITRNRKKASDQVRLKNVSSAKLPISKVRSVPPKVLNYAQSRASGRSSFLVPEYDLVEVGLVEDTDSYCRQAFKKKNGLMFKEGFEYSGANKDTIRYMKTRMAQIARATKIPTIELLKRVAHSLIRVSNAFIVKVRDPKASWGRVRTTPDGKKLKPVAGYFPAAPETMLVELDRETGKTIGWRQMLPDGRYRDFKSEDVIHFTIDRREGFIFGVPTLVPVIDDIRALRQLEENIELLLYQHLFPLFQYKVGTEAHPAGLTEDGLREIDVVQQQIRLMPLEGGIVTPERHEITAIGSEGRAVRAEGYLDHFKKRVVAGLGISQIDLGDGQTTNRATANTLSRALIDTVKDIQDAFEAQWDAEVTSELLLESTFGDNILEEENMVYLRFNEIDIQNKIDLEAHNIELFKANGLTYDEFRSELGHEPIPVPEDPEDQDMEKYPEWAMTYWKLIEEPMNLIRAVDEPWSPAAQAAAQARSTSLTSKALAAAQGQREKEAQKEASEDRKTKVAVTRARPRPNVRDNYLRQAFTELEADTEVLMQKSLNSRGVIDYAYLTTYARTWAAHASKKMKTRAISNLTRGIGDTSGKSPRETQELVRQNRDPVESRVERTITRLALFTIQLVRQRIDATPQDVTLIKTQRTYATELHVAFDAARYRTDFIYDVEIRKAYNFGKVLGLKFFNKVAIRVVPNTGACDRCRAVARNIEDPAFTTIDNVVPIHSGCKCEIQVVTIKEPFEDEVVEDADKLERCVLKVKADLRRRHPDWDEKKIKSSAFAICSKKVKKEEDVE
jgi:hypothetical protein